MLRTGHKVVDSVVVGGGPSGIAVLGHLLERDVSTQQRHHLWIDPLFRAGRVDACYRQVPSNTKVELFVKFATAVAPFRRIVETTQVPNAFTALKDLPQDEGCMLGKAADLCLMLTDGLRIRRDVQSHGGRVAAANLDKVCACFCSRQKCMLTEAQRSNLWTVTLDDGKESVVTRRLVLCTGSSPVEPLWPVLSSCSPDMSGIHLDTALNPPLLSETLSQGVPTTIAVVGASHSAILILMNIFNLASTTHPNLRVKWFTRQKALSYAVYKDGWILRDNTGLKGRAAEWAHQNLDDHVFTSSPVSKVVTRFCTPATEEEQVYRAEMPGCTHVVQAVGYRPDPLPRLTATDSKEPLDLEHDGLTGRFVSAQEPSQYVAGLFGAGIAFPERVTDPLGHQEHAVGFWKFMAFCNRVVPSWIDSTEHITA